MTVAQRKEWEVSKLDFLNRLFGSSKDEVWQQLCREIGADFIDGGFWKGDKVQAHFKGWTITLDTQAVPVGRSTVTYTRMRAPYRNEDGFRFKIYRKGVFSGLGKMLGMQDVEVGDADFDRDFIIQANDEAKVRTLCANPKIRELIEAQPSIHLETKDDESWSGIEFPEGVDELSFEVVGDITDVARLKSLYDLFAETLDHLAVMGSASADDPKILL